MLFVPQKGVSKSMRLMPVLRRLRLTNGLKLALDVADNRSYPGGSEQVWSDQSGGGFHFNRGSGSGSDAADPTFNGVANTLAAYWSFDGGDYFTLGQSNPTWVNNLHKDNAQFSFILWVYLTATGQHGFCGTRSQTTSGNTGFLFRTSNDTAPRFLVANSGTEVALAQMTGQISLNSWHMISLSVDEAVGANGTIAGINTSFELFTSTYTSPATGNASFTFQAAAIGNGTVPPQSGARMAMFTAWEGRALTQGEVTAFFNATRRRFGA